MNPNLRTTVAVVTSLSLLTACASPSTPQPETFPQKFARAGNSIGCYGEHVTTQDWPQEAENPFAHVVAPETELTPRTFSFGGRTYEMVAVEASSAEIKAVEDAIPRFYKDFGKALEKSGIPTEKVREIIDYLSHYQIQTSIVLVGVNAHLSEYDDMGLYIPSSLGAEAVTKITGHAPEEKVNVGQLVQDELAITGVHDSGFNARSYHFSKGLLPNDQEFLAITIHAAYIGETNKHLVPFAPELLTQEAYPDVVYSIAANELYAEAWRTMAAKYPDEYQKLTNYLLDKWGFFENCPPSTVATTAAQMGWEPADIYGEAGSTAFTLEILEQRWLELTKRLQSLELKLLKALSSVGREHLNKKRSEILNALGFAQSRQRQNELAVETLHQGARGTFWADKFGAAISKSFIPTI